MMKKKKGMNMAVLRRVKNGIVKKKLTIDYINNIFTLEVLWIERLNLAEKRDDLNVNIHKNCKA